MTAAKAWLTSPPDKPHPAATSSTTAPVCRRSWRRLRRAPASASAALQVPRCRYGATAPPRTGCCLLRRRPPLFPPRSRTQSVYHTHPSYPTPLTPPPPPLLPTHSP